jgi:hypothetical protein
VDAIQEWAAQCHGVDTGLTAQLPYNPRDGLIGGVDGSVSGFDSLAVSDCRRGEDSPLTRRPWRARAFNALVEEAGVGVTSPGRPQAR